MKNWLLFLAGVSLLMACESEKKKEEQTSPSDSTATAEIQNNPLKEAYFGDLHLHTALSFDAYVFGTKALPDDAYKYAKGDSISYFNTRIKRSEPLDFLAVTDHSEFMGVFNTVEDTSSLLAKSGLGKQLKSTDPKEKFKFFTELVKAIKTSEKPNPLFVQENVIKSTWQQEIKAANENYAPGKFTTFIAYEWSAIPNGANLHRNVIYKGDKAPEKPFSSIDSKRPEDLWTFLESSRANGLEVLAIPHNQNVSDGRMFGWVDSDGNPIDQKYAQRRILNEPLNEISQNKGQSETHPTLSPDDEFANFEVLENLLIGDRKGKLEGSYVREAYGTGLAIEQKVGTNPYKFGVIGASDLHTGLSVSREEEYKGGVGPNFGGAKQTLAYNKDSKSLQTILFGSGNITGVWAEQNTRDAIFDALKRKEVYATSGPKLKFRFFGGWDYQDNLLQEKEWIKTAYDKGVPMGGDLPAKGEAKAPKFVVWGIKDPNGANLDRIQIIKVSLKNGKPYEKIFDVALSDERKPDAKGKIKPVGTTVDLKTATYQNTIGDTELGATWTDPEFDATVAAVYYVRVLEIPTPRWSTVLAVAAGEPVPTAVPPTVQERGWSSPIFYTPSK